MKDQTGDRVTRTDKVIQKVLMEGSQPASKRVCGHLQ